MFTLPANNPGRLSALSSRGCWLGPARQSLLPPHGHTATTASSWPPFFSSLPVDSHSGVRHHFVPTILCTCNCMAPPLSLVVPSHLHRCARHCSLPLCSAHREPSGHCSTSAYKRSAHSSSTSCTSHSPPRARSKPTPPPPFTPVSSPSPLQSPKEKSNHLVNFTTLSQARDTSLLANHSSLVPAWIGGA